MICSFIQIMCPAQKVIILYGSGENLAVIGNFGFWWQKLRRKNSETWNPNDLWLSFNDLCMTASVDSSYCLDPTKKIAAMGNSYFWIWEKILFLWIYRSKWYVTLVQMIYMKSSTKIPYLIIIRWKTWRRWTILVSETINLFESKYCMNRSV